MALSSQPILSIKNLKTYFFTYKGVVHAVDGVSIDINEGEVVGLVGETGCGKSCTALSILRLIMDPGRIIDGQIIFRGKDLLMFSDEEMRKIRGKEIAMIFQNPASTLNPVLTIADQMTETIIQHNDITKQDALEEAVRLLEATGIPSPSERIKNYAHEFSSGMQQRIVIAMALSCNPSLLIADEPTTALDVTIQAQILELLKNLQKQFNASILYITHNLGVVAEICDRVAVMYAGKIFEFSDVETIFKEPFHPYTSGLMRALPKQSKGEKLQEIPGTVPSLISIPPGCRFASRCPDSMDICKTISPDLEEYSPGHLVACHLKSKGANYSD